MRKFSEHIAFRIATLVLVLTLLVPTGVKFSHVFTHQHHHHEVCKGEPETHLHNADFDCSFYKFKLSSPFTIPVLQAELVMVEINTLKTEAPYAFLSEFQQLHFSLRGPPQISLS
ncbi:hypothetical protein M0G43_10850 [Subsaxibacter sp. CAU 1640]|uniref:hypothetical protein n=1 Tax=Subsaxibacter sp. CAU 1640 TaxID=2933271 RepID=UPI002003E323|nr:hypothetical protein [Subsaxibacter sp. CAU 1640]MCK7591073.1 hypothetical protein [Subsaxibacter sp. CAU 1640]